MIYTFIFGCLMGYFFMGAIDSSSPILLTVSLAFLFYMLVIIPQKKYYENIDKNNNGGTE